MKLIDRYLLRALLVPLIYCLAAFIMIYVVYDLFDHLPDFIKAETALSDVVRYYAFLIPSVVILIVPISLLLAVLYSLSLLTKNNELTAMRASGVSLYRLLIPFAAVGLFFTGIVFYINERVGPESAYWCHRFIHSEKNKDDVDVDVVYNQPLKNELQRRIWLIQEFDTVTFDMKGVLLTQEREDGSYDVEYNAAGASWMDGEWWFHDVTVQNYDAYSNPRGAPTNVSHVAMDFLDETPKDFLNEISYNQEFMAADDIAAFVQTRPGISAETKARYRTDYHYRLALPWTCFIVTLLGIPLGSATGRKGAFFGVFMSIGLFFAYYVTITYCLALGKTGVITPVIAGWVANVVFFAIGATSLYRMR